jgi:hypothetical protein
LPAPKANASGGNKSGEVQDRKDTKAIKTAIQTTLEKLKAVESKTAPKDGGINPFQPNTIFNRQEEKKSSKLDNPNKELITDLESLIKGGDISLKAYTDVLKQYGLSST